MSQDNVAIKITNINKTFYIRDDKKSSIKSLVAGMFRQGKSSAFKALTDINVEFERGDFIGIIGRNGSGKSTLLKLIAGIYAPDKGGDIEINGHLVPFLELGVGFNPELTGKENIFLNGTILGMTSKFLEENYDEIVEFAGLKEFINNPVKNYSSGMLVRLAFSIAVKAEADIYILDEILGVGDSLFQQKSIDTIKRFSEEGKTILYVSHNSNSVREYCNKVLWIDHGNKKFFGDVETGLNMYKDSLFEEQKKNLEVKRQIEASRQDKSQNKIIIKDVQVEHQGKDLTLSIKLDHKKPVEELNLVAQFCLDSGEVVSTINSAIDGQKIPSNAEEIRINVKDMAFSPGTYYVNIKAFGTFETQYDPEKREDKYSESNLYDTVTKVGAFKIDSKPGFRGGYGVVMLQHSWEV